MKIRDYSCFRKDFNCCSRATGTVAILISNNFPHFSIPLNTNLQTLAVQIHFCQLIIVCTICLPPNDPQQQDLNNIIMQLSNPFIILGDFNTHNPLWGNPDVNTFGHLIEDFITGICLCILNNGDNTYFHESSKAFHAIDFAICSPILFPFFNFLVCQDLLDSDHFLLLLSFHYFNQINHKNPK